MTRTSCRSRSTSWTTRRASSSARRALSCASADSSAARFSRLARWEQGLHVVRGLSVATRGRAASKSLPQSVHTTWIQRHRAQSGLAFVHSAVGVPHSRHALSAPAVGALDSGQRILGRPLGFSSLAYSELAGMRVLVAALTLGSAGVDVRERRRADGAVHGEWRAGWHALRRVGIARHRRSRQDESDRHRTGVTTGRGDRHPAVHPRVIDLTGQIAAVRALDGQLGRDQPIPGDAAQRQQCAHR